MPAGAPATPHVATITLQSGVPPNDVSDTLLCAGTLLLSGVIGFIFSGFAGGRYTSPYTASQNAVIAARLAANEPRRPRLPDGPRGVLSGSVLVLLVGWRWNCTRAPYPYWLFATTLVVCAISSGVWLMTAASVSNAAEQERHARIEAFIADPDAPVPAPVHGLESMPAWFAVWNRVHVGMFALATGWLLLFLLRLASSRPG